jgi:xanthine dehydrogenase molybdopterin-binding subunit B
LEHAYDQAVLGKSAVKVEAIVKRVGGGFGSKFTKNLWVCAAAAVAANKLGAAVKMQNSIEVDMTMGGNCRHPFEINYKAGEPSHCSTALPLHSHPLWHHAFW